MSALLEVEDLSVGFRTPRGVVQALSQASVTIEPGELLLIVGESGSGKTVLAHTLLRLLPRNVNVSGSVRLGDEDLLGLGHERAAPRARPADGADPAEPRIVAEPGAQARRPAARGRAGARADRGEARRRLSELLG